ncbi:VOC family protein [Streptomyces huasconensis]|uniref:VOC family protein n=1 Tax=Streptomyces huasconensis TaxID=1854574 RepID=UPI0036F75256
MPRDIGVTSSRRQAEEERPVPREGLRSRRAPGLRPAWTGGGTPRENRKLRLVRPGGQWPAASGPEARSPAPVPPGEQGPRATAASGRPSARPGPGVPPGGGSREGLGAPCGLSLAVRDLRAAEEFYGRVLGWCHVPLIGTQGRARSLMLKAGAPVATLGQSDCAGPDLGWMPYFAVDDVDRAVGRLSERGATVAVGPLTTGSGRAAVAAGPEGAVFGLRHHAPDEEWRVGQGPVARLELYTRDIFAAALFYGGVLGWAGEPGESCSVEYVDDRIVVRDGPRPVAALVDGAAPGAGGRHRWHTSFRVADVDATAAAAVRWGGGLVSAPRGLGSRREAVLADREGSVFAVTAS